MTDQLKLTIASGVVHGLKCRLKHDAKSIFRITAFDFLKNIVTLSSELGHVYGTWSIYDIELLMHPISKLAHPILPDGRIPIVELLKMQNKNFFNNEMSERYNEIEIEVVPNYIAAYVKFLATIQIKLWINEVQTWPTWITDQLDAWHINYRYIEVVEIIND